MHLSTIIRSGANVGSITLAKTKAEEIYGAAKELVPILPKDDLTKLIVKQSIEQLNTASKTVEELRTLMNDTAAKLPEYPVVMGYEGCWPVSWPSAYG